MNVYYDPEKFGLKIVAEADFGSGYDFSKVIVWRTSDGRLVWAMDSGCSCPLPFEDVGLDDLKELVSLDEFEGQVRDYFEFEFRTWDGEPSTPMEWVDLLAKVIAARQGVRA